MKYATILLCLITCSSKPITLTSAQAHEIGQKIWHNECGKSCEKLTWWGQGEEFASLGIGHFIWHPENSTSPFTQTFPPLIQFLCSNNVTIPDWLRQASCCPWKNRDQFLADMSSARMIELRTLLANTLNVQTLFMIQQLETALPNILQHAPAKKRARIQQHCNALLCEPQGMYALIDYTNFKGTGINKKERYNDQGWGLLQVLDAMRSNCTQHPTACTEFAACADALLTARVRNAPPERHEERWLPGWKNRVATYNQ